MVTNVSTVNLNYPVRILAVFGGDAARLNLAGDLEELQNLIRLGAKITLLITDPSQINLEALGTSLSDEINIISCSVPAEQNSAQHTTTVAERIKQQLRDFPWDILFFAGHSYSERNLSNGYLVIGSGRRISVEALLPDIGDAARRGLKIAIFNSCDGMGIAQKLIARGVRTVIVFREPVPDSIARLFLQEFLRTFSSGASFYQSVRSSRNRLHLSEHDPDQFHPSATWLPVIYTRDANSNWVWPRPSSVYLCETALNALRNGKCNDAILNCDRAIELDQHYADAYFNRGLARKEQNETELALSDFQKALDLYESQGNSEGYQNAQNEIWTLTPTSAQLCEQAQAAYRQWSISQRSNALEDAISSYTEAIDQNADWDSSANGYNLAKAYHDRGRCYDDQRNYQEAIEDYNRAIELDQHYADAYFNRGLARKEQNETELALSDFQKALDLYESQGNSEGYQNAQNGIRDLMPTVDLCRRALEAQHRGDYVAAISDYTEAIERNVGWDSSADGCDSVIVYSNRGYCYYKQQEYQRALEDCSRAIQHNPDYADAYSCRSMVWEARNEPEQAVADLEQAARLYHDQGNIQEEQNVRQRIRSLTPSSAELCKQAQTAYQRAVLSQQSNDYNTAILGFTQAIERNQDWDNSLGYTLARAYYDRGRCYDDQRNYQGAIEDYNQAIENNPDYADAYLHRGLLLKRDNRKRALADFRQAVRFYPQDSEGCQIAEREIHALAWGWWFSIWYWIDRRRRGLMLFISLSVLVLALVLIPGLFKNRPPQLPSPSPSPGRSTESPTLDGASSDISKLIENLQRQRSPKDIIDLNNEIVKRNATSNNTVLTIAAVVPGGNNPDQETLRGVAQAQSEFNCFSSSSSISSSPSMENPIESFMKNVIGQKTIHQCQGSAGRFLEVVLKTYSDENLIPVAQGFENVLGVVGRYTSGDLEKVAPYYRESKLILITTTSNATRKKLSLTNQYVYRVIPDVTTVAQRLKSEFGSEKIEIIRDRSATDKNAYAASLEDEIVEMLSETTINNLNPFCSFDSEQFNAEKCTESIRGGVVFLIPNLTPDEEIQNALSLIKAIDMSRLEVKIVGSDTLYDQRLRTGELGKVSEKLDVLVIVPWARDKNDATPFEKGALALWGGLINWRTAMAYDATKVLIQGLKDNPTREGLKDALSRNFVLGGQGGTTATGKIEFEENGDRRPYPQLFVEVRRDISSDTGYNFFKNNEP